MNYRVYIYIYKHPFPGENFFQNLSEASQNSSYSYFMGNSEEIVKNSKILFIPKI